MVDIRFKKYLEKNYYDKLFYALKEHLDNNRNNVNDTCRLDDVFIKNIKLGNDEDSWFYGDLYVDASIKNFDNDYEDGHREHFFIKIQGNLEHLRDTFKIIDIDDNPHEIFHPLKSNFMPYIEDNEEYDKIASEFLSKYYPEAYNGEGIDVNVLLNRIGFSLEEVKLSLDSSVFAMIVFEDANIDVYENNNKISKTVKKNTILIDNNSSNCFQENKGIDLFTIIHECAHFYAHKKYFYFQKLINNKDVISSCKITGEYDSFEDIKWLEVQANKIASRILMPKEVIAKQIEDYKSCNNLESNNDYEQLLIQLQKRFGVSIAALKVRLNELGYTKFSGICEYVDDRYLEPYISKKDIEPNESFSIGMMDFIILSISSIDLRKELESGNYIYVDGHVCLNSTKYIERVDGLTKLTDYALNNIDECCLKFKYTLKSNVSSPITKELFLCRLLSHIKGTIQFVNPFTGKKVEDIDSKDWRGDLDKLSDFMSKLPNSFGGTLKEIIKEYCGTQANLEKYSGVDISTIEKLCSGKNTNPKRKTLLRICIGMRLDPILSEDLFKKAGIDLSASTQENFFIKQAINNMYECDLEEVMRRYNEVVKEEYEDE